MKKSKHKFIHFIKNLIFGYNNKLKVIVKRHCDNTTYYRIEYKLPGYGMDWQRLTKFINYHFIIDRNLKAKHLDIGFPYLEEFGEAVAYAKTLKTPHDIHNHLLKELEKYDTALKSLKIPENNSWQNF